MLIVDRNTYVKSKENELAVQVEEGSTRGRYVCMSDEKSKLEVVWKWKAQRDKKLPFGVIMKRYGDGMELEWKRGFIASDSGTYICMGGKNAVAYLHIDVIRKFLLPTNVFIFCLEM